MTVQPILAFNTPFSAEWSLGNNDEGAGVGAQQSSNLAVVVSGTNGVQSGQQIGSTLQFSIDGGNSWRNMSALIPGFSDTLLSGSFSYAKIPSASFMLLRAIAGLGVQTNVDLTVRVILW